MLNSQPFVSVGGSSLTQLITTPDPRQLDELADWMLTELQGEIEASGVQAAWIKLSAGDEGLTPCETKILRAAAMTGWPTSPVYLSV